METSKMTERPNPGYANEDEMIADLAGEARMLGRLFARKWHGVIPPEDIYQTALLGAVLAFRSYDPAQAQGLPMRNWICSKMRFAIYDLRRAEKGRNRTARIAAIHISIDRCPQGFLAVDGFRALSARLDVERLMKKVPADSRPIIRRHFLEGETLDEIAAGENYSGKRAWQIERKGLNAMRAAA